MSSPIHLDEDIDPGLIYAPPLARQRIRPVVNAKHAVRTRTGTSAKMISRNLRPKFSGDRAMLELQRELALDPDLVPEPSSEGDAVIRPLLIRLCSVTALAAVVAWALVSYSDVRKTAQIMPVQTSVPAITSSPTKSADVQPLGLRPSLPQTAETLAQVGKPPPVSVKTASAEAVTSIPAVKESAAAALPTVAPAPAQLSNERRPLRLDEEEIAVLIKRGQDFLATGDLAAARLLLRRAAEAGSAEAALALGTTFDPVALQRLGAIGAVADLAKARQWYQRAVELGSSAASQQLAGLGDVR
jgi:tetratricopeptide (TPR) repeat protein